MKKKTRRTQTRSVRIRVSKAAEQIAGLRSDIQDLHNRIDDMKRDIELDVARRVENAMASSISAVNQARAVVGEAKRGQHTMVQQILELIDDRYRMAFDRLNAVECKVKKLCE